jgi:hypothetical protein
MKPKSIQYVVTSIFKKISSWIFCKAKLCFLPVMSMLHLNLSSWPSHIEIIVTWFNFKFEQDKKSDCEVSDWYTKINLIIILNNSHRHEYIFFTFKSFLI